MGYATRRCPRCGAELYEDMAVCYGCLYDFSRDAAAPRPARSPLELRHADETGVVVRTAALDAWLPVGELGAGVGSGGENDVVLRSVAALGCRVRLTPTPDGMEVADLCPSNPATYHGRAVEGRVVVPYGEGVDVCGCMLVMTGPAPSAGVTRASSRIEKSL